MALNPSIILAGQSPDVVGSLSRGIQTGQQMRQSQTQNALSDVYRTQGAGIMAGDQGALNALAGIDPNAALKVQDSRLGMDATRLGMDATRQSMQMQVQEAQMRAKEYALKVGAAQAQQEAAKLEQALKGASYFYSKGDRAGYDNFLRQTGADPAQYPFDQFEPIAATMGGVLDVLKGFQPQQPEWRPATAEEAAAQGAVAGQINTKTGKFDGQNPPTGMSLTTNPDGTMSLQQGPGVTGGKPLTDAQSKSVTFATRAEGALTKFEPVSDALTSRMERAAEMDPTGLARGLQSDNFQVAKNAGDEFLQAILRKDTGAAITEQEQDLYGKTYLPQPGDGAPVLEAKRAARVRAVEALRAGMSIDEITRTEQAIVKSAERSGEGQPGGQPRRLKFNPETGALE